MKNIFLAKEKNSNDRDCVIYITFNGFECNHYFGGLHLAGACFSGFEKEFKKQVENNFDNLETILTKDEFKKLFELNDKIKGLGYGIEKDSEKYKKGLSIIKEYQETIEKKLLSEENEKLFKKVQEEEKEFIKNEYYLSYEEITEIFDNYTANYKDRAIISQIFNDFDDMITEEKYNFGYEKQQYFDDESFGQDLLDSGNYYKLKTGKIVSYNY